MCGFSREGGHVVFMLFNGVFVFFNYDFVVVRMYEIFFFLSYMLNNLKVVGVVEVFLSFLVLFGFFRYRLLFNLFLSSFVCFFF